MKPAGSGRLGESLEQEIVRRILTAGDPLRIVLFGSFARGEGRANSDLDLLIVEEHSDLPKPKRATPYRMALMPVKEGRDIDIMVWTPPEIEEWSEVPMAFITTILREGKVLHEKRRDGPG